MAAGAFVATIALATVGAVRLADAPPAPAQTVAATPTLSGPPSAAEIARAKARAGQGRALRLGALALQAALFGGFLLAGGTRWLARLVQRFHGRWILALGAVVGIVAVTQAILFFPLNYYGGFVFPHQYGLSNQTAAAWLRDELVGFGVTLLMTLPVVVLFYALLRRAPRTWWVWVGVASAPVLVFVMLIQPVYIDPLFNTFTPLKDAQLREEILTLAHAHGVAAHDVFQIDASRQSNMLNAYVTGVGPTQRIVLYDTLLRTCTPEEVMEVMAHEIGHYVHGHILQGILLGVLGTLVMAFTLYHLFHAIVKRYGDALGVHEVANPAGYPLLLALVFGLSFVAQPIGNALSRHMEREADRFALQAYPHPEAGISVYYKFIRHDLADPTPPRWAQLLFGTHPTLEERITTLQHHRSQNAR